MLRLGNLVLNLDEKAGIEVDILVVANIVRRFLIFCGVKRKLKMPADKEKMRGNKPSVSTLFASTEELF